MVCEVVYGFVGSGYSLWPYGKALSCSGNLYRGHGAYNASQTPNPESPSCARLEQALTMLTSLLQRLGEPRWKLFHAMVFIGSGFALSGVAS